MLQMIEVVGVSPVGFTEAVKNAVETLMGQGKVIHFFQVVEQRGSVRDNAIREFQVVVKIACESR